MRPFAPCFRVAVTSLHLYLLIRVQIDLPEPFVTMVAFPAGVRLTWDKRLLIGT
jgi:hypothetical protein